jgi:diguanylate cyclase
LTEKFNLSEVDEAFEEKVYVIADEVLNILKDLSRENRELIDSRMIAEKMFWSAPVKNLLSGKNKGVDSEVSREVELLRDWSNAILSRFSELLPPSEIEKIADIRDQFREMNITLDSTEWMDSPIKIIKKYISSLVVRNKELEDFLQQTTEYLTETEKRLGSELESQQTSYKVNNRFNKHISSNVMTINDHIRRFENIDEIRAVVISKIENINLGIEKKQEHDMIRLRETEKNLEAMGRKMLEIKQEADEIRRRSQELEFESIRDTLTGLYNRKAYDDKIDETIAHVSRYNIDASLLVCDIDYFKKINDTFGHKVGDLALKKLAQLLRTRLRQNDFICRYGGEEFAVILPHTDLKGAKQAAEGIRSYIDNAVFTYSDNHIPLKISIGVSTFEPDDDADSVFERADRALYLAKRAGRNCVRTQDDLLIESGPSHNEYLSVGR